MKELDFARWISQKPVIGMVHLAPLIGSPRASASTPAQTLERALADCGALIDGGCHGLMMENFGDTPFFPGRVPAHVVACMAAIACDIKRSFKVPLGINVLRNDGLSALATAVASGADFIRVNVLSGARVTDQGVIQGIAHDLMRERMILGAQAVRVLADVDVKHSAPLASRPIEEEVHDVIKRGMADAVVVSGSGTGMPVDMQKLCAVKSAAGHTPVFIGSGATAHSLHEVATHADGFIVGSAFKAKNDPTGVVQLEKVRELMKVHSQLKM